MRHELLTDRNIAEEIADVRQVVRRFEARRADDLFVADVLLYNLRVTGSPPLLVRIDPGADATLVLQLPPQAFGEEAYLDATGDGGAGGGGGGEPPQKVPAPAGTRIRMAAPSRLAFAMPDHVASVPFTLQALLQASRSWPLRRAFSAAPEPGADSGHAGSDALLALATSRDFAMARRAHAQVLREQSGAGGLDAMAAAAGRRIAQLAVREMRRSDAGSANAAVLHALRSELSALAPRFPMLRNPRSRSLLTMGIVHEAIAALAAVEQAGAGQFGRVPLLSLALAPYRPSAKVTAIEMPYRLLLSPIGSARFTHRAGAETSNGRNELWHTRLTVGPRDYGADTPAAVRAIWSEDYLLQGFAHTENVPFRMPLAARDRKALVQVTTGFNEDSPGVLPVPYVPRPARARRMMLSALGGLLDVEGAWQPRPTNVDLEQWRHLASLGRDHYVRVVNAGFLLPFGHAASFVKVTERKFEGLQPESPLASRVAVLRQRFFLVVREPVKRFDGSYHETGGHPFPFTSVELLTRVTPDLLDPGADVCRAIEVHPGIYDREGLHNGLGFSQLFWPMLSSTPGSGNLRFDIAATDRDGQRVTFALPLLFMSEVGNTGQVTAGNQSAQRMAQVIAAYNAEGPGRRTAQLGGVTVCLAPPGGADRDGDPRIPAHALEFRAGRVASQSTSRINTYPELSQATVTLRAVQRILGRDHPPVTVGYHPVYAEQGFGGDNAGEVFLQLLPASSEFDVSFGPGAQAARSDAVGAVASPAMGIQGVSRRIGLSADLAEVQQNRFDPSRYFPDARILGGIRLADVVTRIVDLAGPDAPRFTAQELPPQGTQPARTEARYDWQTRLDHADPHQVLLPRADGSNDSPFRMLAITTTPAGESQPAVSTATATIGNFKVNLFTFIVLWFRELRFTSVRGRKPEVTVDLHPTRGVEFGGPLEFVNQLRDLLPGNGFSDPSALTVTPNGIAASYSLGVPSVQVGIFALSGLSVGARFSLPFDTRPMEVGFNFADRENPFSLTVSLLGGGGFLYIGVGADGVREIEAALEAGARLAIDLGVASGAVEIKAGIYFHWLAAAGGTGGAVELAGYVRLHGELDIMGIISASLTFNLQLAYRKQGRRSVIWGEATLVIEIDVLLFSGEVTVRCRREFGGSEADPTFAQLIPGDTTWSTYCLAFAED